MKTRAVIIAAAIVGLFAYSLPLYAGNTEYHVEEETVIEIPIVGKITTLTSSHFSGCKLMERTTFKMHNSLIKVMSDDGGKSRDVELSDLCEETQWQYDDEAQMYKAYTFEELKAQHSHKDEESDIHIDMGVDQNDINELPRITRENQGRKKNINGFKAQKIVTLVHLEETENPLIIEEYYSTKAKALAKVNSTREDLKVKLGHLNDLAGVPAFIQFIYKELQEDHEWPRPKGEVVRLVIRMLDKDDDTVFSMHYDVLTSEVISYNEDHFVLN